MRTRKGLARLSAAVSGWLLAAVPGSTIAGDIAYMAVSHGVVDPYLDDFGSGYVKFHRSGFDAYSEWWHTWAQCGRTGDFGPCTDLPEEFAFNLDIEEAFLGDWLDPGMTTSDFHVWSLHAERPYCEAGHCAGLNDTAIVVGDESNQWYVNWDCSGVTGSASRFAFLTDGVACNRSFSGSVVQGNDEFDSEDDGYRFVWQAIEIPEPGTLALLGLGLAGLGVSRRRRRAAKG